MKSSKSTSAPVQPSMSLMDRQYQAEDDHRTLTRADEVRQDASRMKGVRKHHRKMTVALRHVGRTITAGGRGR